MHPSSPQPLPPSSSAQEALALQCHNSIWDLLPLMQALHCPGPHCASCFINQPSLSSCNRLTASYYIFVIISRDCPRLTYVLVNWALSLCNITKCIKDESHLGKQSGRRVTLPPFPRRLLVTSLRQHVLRPGSLTPSLLSSRWCVPSPVAVGSRRAAAAATSGDTLAGVQPCLIACAQEIKEGSRFV
jgi:hypothetical protein